MEYHNVPEYNMENAAENWAVETEGLAYRYEGTDERALDGVDLRIRRGSRVAFLGENGSGKSTFFRCLNGIIKPDEGEIKIHGCPVCYSRKGLLEVRSRVGIVFQDPDSQLFSASVYEDISFGILNKGTDAKTAERKVNQVIEELGIKPFEERPVHALSGGQKKIVSVADILVMEPDIMILDEPAAALDAEHKKTVRRIIDGLSEKGVTLLVSTHDINYAYEWADEIVIFRRGRIEASGSAEKVCRDASLLSKCGLESPAVVRIYHTMEKAGLIDRRKHFPRNMEELESLILGHGLSGKGEVI